MKSIWTRLERARVAFVASLVKYKDRQPPPITRSMIAMELEKLEIEWQSLCATITTSRCGVMTQANSLFISSR